MYHGRRVTKKAFFGTLCLSKHEYYRKTHKYIAFEIPIALRINDSRTNLICQTKQYAPVRVCFRQAPLFAIRRFSGTLAESNTDDAMHLYHDFYWISFLDNITNEAICQYFQQIYSAKIKKFWCFFREIRNACKNADMLWKKRKKPWKIIHGAYV